MRVIPGGISYTYDANGNILTKTDETTGVTISYSYEDPTWADLLTKYNGETITYDAIGNPLTYRGGMSFTWKDGRRLSTATKNGSLFTYYYDGEGSRIGKVVSGTSYTYTVIDGVIYAETRTANGATTTIHYLFDDKGQRFGFVVNGTDYYYYRFNLQGDVTGIYNSQGTLITEYSQGTLITEYTYDAWGKLLSVTGTAADTIGSLNPIRYRGYYYDTETGLYHLQTRYYDPEVGKKSGDGSVIDRQRAESRPLSP